MSLRHYLLPSFLGLVGCQRIHSPLPSDTYQAYVTYARFVIVKGALYPPGYRFDSTLVAIRAFKPVFSCKLRDHSVEYVTDSKLVAGHYRVKLRAGYTYQAAVMVGDKRVWTEEIFIPSQLRDLVFTKNFYAGYE